MIKESIRECQYDNEFYPLKSTIHSRTLAKEWLPPLLLSFMQQLISDEVKQISLGHCIVQASRPRSVVAHILFGLSVSVDQVAGPEIVQILARFGLSISCDEIVRFK